MSGCIHAISKKRIHRFEDLWMFQRIEPELEPEPEPEPEVREQHKGHKSTGVPSLLTRGHDLKAADGDMESKSEGRIIASLGGPRDCCS